MASPSWWSRAAGREEGAREMPCTVGRGSWRWESAVEARAPLSKGWTVMRASGPSPWREKRVWPSGQRP
eukprot:9074793-Alexandrium_andersonii.AAC.1